MKLTVVNIGTVLVLTKRGRMVSDAEECRTLSDILKHVGPEDSLEFTPRAAELLKRLYTTTE